MRKSIATLAAVIALSATGIVFADTASADDFPQGSFTFDGFGGHYVGTCNLNDTSGFRLSCHGSLVSGSPVSQLTDITSGNLHGVVTPGGQVIETVNQ